MGKVYYDMGLLSSPKVEELSATDLIGQYVGQTGPKTNKALEKALGRILLIDEAYRLAEGPFAKEAMDELVDCITKPKFAQKLIIILAGYDNDINHLMTVNPGLTSRFPESTQFNPLGPDHCIDLLRELFRKKAKSLTGRANFDISVIESLTDEFRRQLRGSFDTLVHMSNWANARDVETISKSIFGKLVKNLSGKDLVLDEQSIISEINAMIKERQHRATAQPSDAKPSPIDLQSLLANQDNKEAPKKMTTTHNTRIQAPEQPQEPVQEPSNPTDPRDAGVSDAIWAQLQRDKAAAEHREKEYQRLQQEEAAEQKRLAELKKQEAENLAREEEARKRKDDEERLRLERERIQRELERRAMEKHLEDLRKKREAEEAARRKDMQAQMKLRQLGVCVAGFRWIKQDGGYRCAGGYHFVSDAQLGIS